MHVIVGQGQLDAVLHAKPEDRRAFIEEAAGVLKHRKRKEKALRKLDAMQKSLFTRAKAFRDANTFVVGSLEEMKKRADDGFLVAQWCNSPACEARIKEETGGVTSRNRPFDLEQKSGTCVVCGNASPGAWVWSKAY